MEEYLMAELIKNKGMKNVSEQDFIEKFKDFKNSRYNRYGGMENDPSYDRTYRHNPGMSDWDEDHSIYGRESSYKRHQDMGGHFDEHSSRQAVMHMYHFENGKKYAGEKFDMHKAKEVKQKYRDILPEEATVMDIYVAINAQYHDYAALFKSWYREGVEHKIIESAIVFWFCDVDYKGESKIYDYFDMMN